ncbi:MAG: DoxX family protein [Terracidiphilus sp.]
MSSNSMVHRCAKGYSWFSSLISWVQSPFLLFVRLYWGWQFMQTGWGKLHNLANVAQFFASLGIPAPGPTALFVGCVEFFGGALLILGLGSRLTGLVLTGNMLVAYLTADREALLAVFSDPGKFYGAAPYTFLFAAVLILIFGPGWFALDTLIARRIYRPATERELSQRRITQAGEA